MVRAAALTSLFLSLTVVGMLRRGGGFSGVELLVLAFLAVALISTLSHRWIGSKGWMNLAAFVGTYLMAFQWTTSSRPEQTIALWTWSLLVLYAGVVLLSLSWTLMNPDAYLDHRFQGITWNPNTLGGIAALLMTGAIARSLERDAGHRLGWILLAPLAGICLFLTQSRTAIFGAVAGLIVVALLRKSWPLLLGLVLVFGIYMGAKSVALSLNLGGQMELDVGVREVGFETRAAVWQDQLAIWWEEPWLGQGLQIDPDSGQSRRVGENAYLELLGSVGILGTVSFVFFWWIAAARLVRWAYRIEKGGNPSSGGYHLASAGIIIALLVHALGEGWLATLSQQESIYFWMVLGAACKLRLVTPTDSRAKQLSLMESPVERVSASI